MRATPDRLAEPERFPLTSSHPYNVRMSDKSQFTLRQIDQARSDLPIGSGIAKTETSYLRDSVALELPKRKRTTC
jgi:hypothetical protein